MFGSGMDQYVHTVLKTIAVEHRRGLLFDLLDANPQPESPSTHGDRQLSSEEANRQQAAFCNSHLPMLENAEVIDRDEEAGEVTKGPAFENLEPLLRFLRDYRDGLSGITALSDMANRGESGGAGGLVQTIRRWLGRPSDEPALRTDGGSETAGAHESGATDTVSGFSEEGLSKVELFDEFGITPKQYIVSGLRTYGGRLRQKEIVELTDWSNSTVSRTLKVMEADDAIIRIPLGREKVVCLPEASPDHLDTPDTTSQASNAGQPSTTE